MSSAIPRQVDLGCIGKKTELEPRGRAVGSVPLWSLHELRRQVRACVPALVSLDDGLQPITCSSPSLFWSALYHLNRKQKASQSIQILFPWGFSS